jgi:hypothetical protein
MVRTKRKPIKVRTKRKPRQVKEVSFFERVVKGGRKIFSPAPKS